MERLELQQLFEKYMPKTSKMSLPPADVLSLMVFNIINSPSPLYKVSEQAADYIDGIGEQPDEAAKYNDDRLGRNIDRLYGCERNTLMLDLTADAIIACQLNTDIIHNDSTTITFKGRYKNLAQDGIRQLHGHNKDFRPDCLQLVYGLNITEYGDVPLTFQLSDGCRTDDGTHIPDWDQSRKKPGKTDFIYVADFAIRTALIISMKMAAILLPLRLKIGQCSGHLKNSSKTVWSDGDGRLMSKTIENPPDRTASMLSRPNLRKKAVV